MVEKLYIEDKVYETADEKCRMTINATAEHAYEKMSYDYPGCDELDDIRVTTSDYQVFDEEKEEFVDFTPTPEQKLSFVHEIEDYLHGEDYEIWDNYERRGFMPHAKKTFSRIVKGA